jgi:hypothetical protein
MRHVASLDVFAVSLQTKWPPISTRKISKGRTMGIMRPYNTEDWELYVAS